METPKIDLCFLKSYETFFSALKDLGLSSNQIKKHITNKKLLEAKISSRQLTSISLDIINNGLISPIYSGPLPKILFENDFVVGIDKPAGIHCHPLCYSDQGNLLSWLRQNSFKYLDVNVNSYDRGLINRIDFETSGVVLYSKCGELLKEIRENFEGIITRKIYYAKVSGDASHIKGDYSFHLRPFGPGKKKVVCVETEAPNTFTTILDVDCNSVNDFSIVKITIKSGYRHQIRVVMSELGFPIIGDVLYGGLVSDRLYLHSYNYQIKLGGKSIEISSPLPKDF
ncbi:MAG: hypothetical protein HOE90_19720 [Bacteriovoracaceae bacterium]|jgi:23S rRNA pseudouridine1911/1915/1917 synthase|nr:hypothetical protein [Bacteriovoracaceae bacterium]